MIKEILFDNRGFKYLLSQTSNFHNLNDNSVLIKLDKNLDNLDFMPLFEKTLVSCINKNKNGYDSQKNLIKIIGDLGFGLFKNYNIPYDFSAENKYIVLYSKNLNSDIYQKFLFFREEV